MLAHLTIKRFYNIIIKYYLALPKPFHHVENKIFMVNIKRRSRGESVQLLQEMLNTLGYNLVVDGSFGKGTDAAVRDFQKKNNLVSDGVVGPKTWTVLFKKVPSDWSDVHGNYLTEKDIIDFAQKFDLEVAAVKAVQEVESRGRGFLLNGKPIILFEGHVFWRELKKIGLDPKELREGNEDILYPRWTKEFYKGGEAEYERLDKAKNIKPGRAVTEAALASASWGMYQIMGNNFKACGFDSVTKFVNAMKKSEKQQLIAFGHFIKSNRLLRHLKNKDWAKFARGYNGPGYKKNKYDTKLANAYARHAKAAEITE